MPAISRRVLLGAGVATAAAAATDPTEVIALWPGAPPGAPGVLPREQIVDRFATSGFQDRAASGIGRPQLTVFRPRQPNGAAVLFMPGGSYVRVVIDKEGIEVGRRLAAAGVTGFMLRYRLPAEGWLNRADAPLQDAQRAMRLIRAGAGHFGIDPHRILALGFSAGGHVAASLATGHGRQVYAPIDAADALSARPDFSGLMYPVIDMARPNAHEGSREALLGAAVSAEMEAMYSPQRHVDAATPPTFLAHAVDDPTVPVANSLDYFAALRRAGIPAEAHFFQEGGHGFGIALAKGKPAAAWPDLLLAWAGRAGWLNARGAVAR